MIFDLDTTMRTCAMVVKGSFVDPFGVVESTFAVLAIAVPFQSRRVTFVVHADCKNATLLE